MNINIDTKAIASGMYRMINESGLGECLTFGMLPAEFMQLLDEMLTNKLEELYAFERTKVLIHFNDMPDFFSSAMNDIDKEIEIYHRDFMRDISADIIHIASNSGQCIV